MDQSSLKICYCFYWLVNLFESNNFTFIFVLKTYRAALNIISNHINRLLLYEFIQLFNKHIRIGAIRLKSLNSNILITVKVEENGALLKLH